jgi:type II secretory pathway component GspD/PulD (secretin)
MRICKVAKQILLAGALGLCLAPAGLASGRSEATGVQNSNGNASPTDAASNINEYTFQDEQVNIDAGKAGVFKVLRANQKNLVNDFVVGVFPIRNASPVEIRNAMRIVAASEGGRAEVIRDQQSKENFLFVLAPTFQMPFIEEAMKGLDEKWMADVVDGSADAYYKAKFRDIATVANLARVPASAGTANTSDNVYTLDQVGNSVHFNGEPSRAGSFVKFAGDVDQPVPQVSMKISIYEVDVSNEKKLGLDYMAWKNGPGRSLFNFVWWGTDYDKQDALSGFSPFGVGSGESRGRYYGLNYLLSSEYLDFLEGSGRARVVASGKVVAKNGVTGTFYAVDEVLHFRTANASSTGGTVGDTNIPQYQRDVTKDGKQVIGFRVQVTPYVAEEITELAISFDGGTPSNNVVTAQLPDGSLVVRSHRLSTSVLVKDGQPICVGGLRVTEDVKHTQKMPFLGDIPVLGYFFGHEHSVKREKSMVIVITPTIRFGTEADLAMADPEDRVVRQQVGHMVDLKLPETEYGFDQWVLDSSR